MTDKKFMVVEMPIESTMGDIWLNDPVVFNNYEKAFDYFNERVATEGQQIFRQPKGTVPLRAAMSDRDIELWVITRTDELITD